jgi:hypothetical protein
MTAGGARWAIFIPGEKESPIRSPADTLTMDPPLAIALAILWEMLRKTIRPPFGGLIPRPVYYRYR